MTKAEEGVVGPMFCAVSRSAISRRRSAFYMMADAGNAELR
jgi:hypothetical protein